VEVCRSGASTTAPAVDPSAFWAQFEQLNGTMATPIGCHVAWGIGTSRADLDGANGRVAPTLLSNGYWGGGVQSAAWEQHDFGELVASQSKTATSHEKLAMVIQNVEGPVE
jgi:hypothetical protein